MAFDAGMLACSLSELEQKSLGARVEKVFQPARDEIVIQIRSQEGGKKLLINAGSNNPRIGYTTRQRENPSAPPMFCMLLRKHLQGAKLSGIRQLGFERVAELLFETRDEMGFACARKLIAEVMGKYSNLIFTDGDDKVISALRIVDFSTSSLRQVLPGMKYELPPAQKKTDPLSLSAEEFDGILRDTLSDPAIAEKPCDKWISSTFLGVSAALAREISFRASGRADAVLSSVDPVRLSGVFLSVFSDVRAGRFSPSIVLTDGKPVEYAFLPLTHYGEGFELVPYESAGEMLDVFFSARDREAHTKQNASDLLQIISSSEARLHRKLEAQRTELSECAKGADYRKFADLITANLYQLKRGMTRVELTDYEDLREDGSFGTAVIVLDSRLSPSQNAQSYYKKYNKAKNAEVELTRQISLGEEELAYLASVLDAVERAETAQDLSEIREELFRSGYASKMKHFTPSRKKAAPVIAEFRTRNGLRVLCGKNNVQNDYISHKLAGKNDYWFHVKNMPGSHAVMIRGEGEPDVGDFTDAAEIAACFSKGSGGRNVEVDYTLVRNLKKPNGAKPGFVIYHTNWSCVVTPDEEKVKSMRVK